MERTLLNETEIDEINRVTFKQNDDKVFLIFKDYTAMTKRTIEISFWRNFVSAINQVNEVVEKFHAMHKIPKKSSFNEKKWAKKYYQKNKEKIAKRMVKYYQENKQALIKRNIRWQKDNPEKVLKNRRESSRQYYQNNPEKVKAANKRWQEAHPGYRQEWAEKHRAEKNRYSREWEMKKRKKLAILENNK